MGPLSAPQPAAPLREEAGRISRPHRGGGGREGRRERRGAPDLAPRASGERQQLGLQRATCRPQRTQMAPGTEVNTSARSRTSAAASAPVQQADAHGPGPGQRLLGGREGGRAARGGLEVGGGVLYRRPAPRRPAPSEARARPRAGLSRNNLLETAGRSPQQSAGSRGDPACAAGRQDRGPAPRMGRRPQPCALQPPALTPARGRARDTQLLR